MFLEILGPLFNYKSDEVHSGLVPHNCFFQSHASVICFMLHKHSVWRAHLKRHLASEYSKYLLYHEYINLFKL